MSVMTRTDGPGFNRNYHFFTSSAANWQTHGSLRECQRLQEKRDKEARYMQPRGYSVWKVLLPNDANYRIIDFCPDLPDDQLIYLDTVVYKQVKGKNGTYVKPATGKAALERD